MIIKLKHQAVLKERNAHANNKYNPMWTISSVKKYLKIKCMLAIWFKVFKLKCLINQKRKKGIT